MLLRPAFAMMVMPAASIAGAAGYGPAMPPAAKITPVEETIALYKDMYGHQNFKPCAPARPGEITVCGRGRGGSPDRLPLPWERGPRDSPRQPTGEIPSAHAGLVAAGTPCDGIGCGPKEGINLLTAPSVLVKGLHGLIDPEWASDQE
jgi:hypothetical protein